ncbi:MULTISPECIES: type II secretion system protein GspM [unclassified Bordetella]|uniref:type II secretion system protein GspM n=1 Tax=unclassified Bordetella TaxID=2630031 RepID=UPI0013659B74|nr:MULTISPECIES: type II secretion system protein GspM [unclassified Bordetella]
MSTPFESPTSHAHRQGRQVVQRLRQQLSAWWRVRTPREQRLLRVALAVLIGALVWSWAIQPAWRTISLSRAELPQLQAQAARVEGLIRETRALKSQRTGGADYAHLTEELTSSLGRAGLAPVARVTVGPDSNAGAATEWTVTFNQADVARVMQWLADLPHVLHVQPQYVELERSTIGGRQRAGSVNGMLRIAMPKEAS